MKRIKSIHGDITKLEVDAVVNAANSSLLGGGGVDGAIHRAGGPQILEECVAIRNRQGGCKTGEAVYTSAGLLPAKYVIHTVGPVWGGDKGEKEILLANCYNNSLKMASKLGIKTIAFPNISTGIYHFPKAKAAQIAVDVVKAFLKTHSEIDEVYFVCFDEENFNHYRDLITTGKKFVHSAMLGLAVGDALGVPVEFQHRTMLDNNPVTDMRAFGTHHQPAGTWSDDSSLAFCLADMLTKSYDLDLLARNFVNWYEFGYWSAHGKVFDVGIATSQAITSLRKGCPPALAGGNTENSNGNGSLMRILPLAFYTRHFTVAKRFDCIAEISSLTHRHIRSILACFIYVEMIIELMETGDKWKALQNTRTNVNSFLNNNPICSQAEMDKFHRILLNPINDYEIKSVELFEKNEVYSSGYVVHTLEAAFWCFLNTETYAAAVLQAVNLGEDTDTTAAVTGGLAGIYYGCESFPVEWLNVLVGKNDILRLCDRLEAAVNH